MSATIDLEARPSQEGPFRRAEGWMDGHGKGAWIAAMVLGFILFWPIGLALLFYMIWSKRMFSKSCGGRARHRHGFHADSERMNRRHGFRTSGNTAFDAYKADTLKRLMDEQEQFEAFLDRLRAAKDQSEFDAFMDDRATAASESPETDLEDLDEVDDTSAKPAKS